MKLPYPLSQHTDKSERQTSSVDGALSKELRPSRLHGAKRRASSSTASSTSSTSWLWEDSRPLRLQQPPAPGSSSSSSFCALCAPWEQPRARRPPPPAVPGCTHAQGHVAGVHAECGRVCSHLRWRRGLWRARRRALLLLVLCRVLFVPCCGLGPIRLVNVVAQESVQLHAQTGKRGLSFR